MFFLTILFFQGQTFSSKHQELTLTLDHPSWVMKDNVESPFLFQAMNFQLKATIMASDSGGYQDTRLLKYTVYALARHFQNPKVLKMSRKDSGDMKCIAITMKAELHGQELFLNFLQVGQGWEYFLLQYNFPSTSLAKVDREVDKLLATLRFREKGPGQASPYSSDFEVLKYLKTDNIFKISQQFLAETEKENPDMDLLNRLIKQGADPNYYEELATPLVLAGYNHNLNLVRWLLEHGAEANHQMVEDTIVSVGMQAPLSHYLIQLAGKEREKYPKKPIKRTVLSNPFKFEPDHTFEMFFYLEMGSLEKFKESIANGADPKTKDDQGNTIHQLIERYIADMKTLGADPTPYQAIQSYLNSQ